jgi:hypothetical protein
MQGYYNLLTAIASEALGVGAMYRLATQECFAFSLSAVQTLCMSRLHNGDLV